MSPFTMSITSQSPAASQPANVVPMEVDVRALFQPRSGAVPVWDLSLKCFGALQIERRHLQHTAALALEDSSYPEGHHSAGVCLSFQHGSCAAGASCPHLHVDPAYLSAVRTALQSMPHSDCCFGHGDLPSCRADFQALLHGLSLMIVWEDGGEVPIAPHHICFTAFWRPFLTSAAHRDQLKLKINELRICRLHQRSACHRGVNCNNLHVCRQYWSTALQLSSALQTLQLQSAPSPDSATKPPATTQPCSTLALTPPLCPSGLQPTPLPPPAVGRAFAPLQAPTPGCRGTAHTMFLPRHSTMPCHPPVELDDHQDGSPASPPRRPICNPHDGAAHPLLPVLPWHVASAHALRPLLELTPQPFLAPAPEP
eukprot:GGOE01030026.1.p1 GENE.GGOE01030026.1~~GGOE01030026.1.p1  ORF type:complete len:385 (+),score=75.75 GGOE01030026.1:49-1155(+)